MEQQYDFLQTNFKTEHKIFPQSRKIWSMCSNDFAKQNVNIKKLTISPIDIFVWQNPITSPPLNNTLHFSQQKGMKYQKRRNSLPFCLFQFWLVSSPCIYLAVVKLSTWSNLGASIAKAEKSLVTSSETTRLECLTPLACSLHASHK